MSDTRKDFNPVGLYFHSRAAAVAELAPVKLEVDKIHIDRKPARQSFQKSNQALPMGFTRR
jgi:hypothetical protein